jgi:hypothetical protein
LSSWSDTEGLKSVTLTSRAQREWRCLVCPVRNEQDLGTQGENRILPSVQEQVRWGAEGSLPPGTEAVLPTGTGEPGLFLSKGGAISSQGDSAKMTAGPGSIALSRKGPRQPGNSREQFWTCCSLIDGFNSSSWKGTLLGKDGGLSTCINSSLPSKTSSR